MKPEAAPLDLHEAIAPPGGCERWPKDLLLRGAAHDGIRLVPGRCKATNQCDYCSRIAAVETSEMVLLDAMEYAPTLYVVLTARELLTRAECRDHLGHLRRAVRRRWVAAEWCVLVEFQRRGALHLNLLVKGVPVEDEDELRAVVARVWCSRVDAAPIAQFVGEVSDGAGLVRYIALHFLKPSQAPPKGWRGHRFSATRGYLVRPASEMRQEARRSLRLKRALHRGVPGDLLEHELELEDAIAWELVRTRRSPAGLLVGHAPASPPSPPARRVRAPASAQLASTGGCGSARPAGEQEGRPR